MRIVGLAQRHPVAAALAVLALLAAPAAVYFALQPESSNAESEPAAVATATVLKDAPYATWEVADPKPAAEPVRRAVAVAEKPAPRDAWNSLSTLQVAAVHAADSERELDLPAPAEMGVHMSPGEKNRLLKGGSVEGGADRARGPIVQVGVGGVCLPPPTSR